MAKKIIEIEMIDGTVYENNTEFGWNLDSVDGIKECMQDSGYYELAPDASSTWIRIYSHDVKDMRVKH